MARPRTVQRFDRTVDVLCRRGFVSLLTQGWVDRDAQAAMGRLHAFGRLIGNSDMLQGNLGFHLVDSGPLPLAPAYDMLPMSLAPSRTGVLRAATPLASIAPERSGQLAHLHWAAPLAVDYWQRVAASALLRSGVLRELAAENARRVQEMGRRFG